MSEAQLPRPVLPGYASMLEARKVSGNPHAPPPPFTVDYFEGCNVGYRWYEARKLTPLFPFGFGLSYSTFWYSNLKAEGGKTLTVSFDVTNTGAREGYATPEVYSAMMLPNQMGIRHLIGWSKLLLKPGETGHAQVVADARLLAHFDATNHNWRIQGGSYKVTLGQFAGDAQLTGEAKISPQRFAP
jgi:beta-glucosidase